MRVPVIAVAIYYGKFDVAGHAGAVRFDQQGVQYLRGKVGPGTMGLTRIVCEVGRAS